MLRKENYKMYSLRGKKKSTRKYKQDKENSDAKWNKERVISEQDSTQLSLQLVKKN